MRPTPAQNEARFNVDGFSYNPQTGQIFRRGRPCGGVTTRGYVRIQRDGVHIFAHRLAWRLHFGAWPALQIDHRNGVKSDNRIENLREADPSMNNANVVFPTGATGERGVAFRIDRRSTRGGKISSSCWVVHVAFRNRRLQFKASHFISACVAAPLIRRALHGEYAIDNRTAA